MMTTTGLSFKKGYFTESLGYLLYVMIFCMACIQVAGAYNGEYHYDLTIDALNQEGIYSPQDNYLYVNNELVDVISMAHDQEEADDILVPNVITNSEEIEQLFAEKAHFQYYNDNSEISGEWDRLLEQTYQAVNTSEKNNNKRMFLVTLGMSLHTVQDFYAHSNWAELTDNGDFVAKGYAGDVTWFDVLEIDKNSDSGISINSMDHAGIHKDWPSRPHFDTSYREAYYASRQWIRLVRSWVSEDFWNEAMDPYTSTSDWGGLTGHNIPMHQFFTRVLWYSGAWNYGYSRDDLQLLLFGKSYGFIIKDDHDHRMKDEKYRDLYRLPERTGYDYLYNQNGYNPTTKAHPETLAKIPVVRWLRIQTSSIIQTDCDDWPWHLDIDPLNEADFYNTILVEGHHWYREAPNQGSDSFAPNSWVTNVPIPIELETVHLHYQLWDEDVPYTPDDRCDISNPKNEVDYEKTLLTNSSWTEVLTNGLIHCGGSPGIDKSEGDGDEAKVLLTHSFILQDSRPIWNMSIKKYISSDNHTWEDDSIGVASGSTVYYRVDVLNEGTHKIDSGEVWDNNNLIASFGEILSGEPKNYYYSAIAYSGPTNYYKNTATAYYRAGNEIDYVVDSASYHTFETLKVTADFKGSPLTGYAPLTVQFNDTSHVPNLGNPTSYYWHFGEVGLPSTERNPVHVYNNIGTYNVSLTVTNSGGSNITTKNSYITVKIPSLWVPIVNFTVNPEYGVAPLKVTFNDTSTGVYPYSFKPYKWQFGDGTNSSEKNVTHVYQSSGNYNVQHSVTTSYGNSTKSAIIWVIEDERPNTTTKIAIFRPSSGYWYFDNNLDGIVDKSFRFGGSGDQIIAGDWDGDWKDGIAIFRNSSGYWYFDYNLDGIINNSFRYGGIGDRIIKGNWNGTVKDGIAIFRPSSGYWYFDYNLDGIVDKAFRYGGVGDQIIKGDWGGTDRDGIAIFRPSTGYWYFDYNLDGIVEKSFRYGGSSDQIIVGKWQGAQDGIAIFRPASGYWYFDYDVDGIVDKSFRYGGVGDQIIKGDWDGDGKDGIAIFRPSSGYWYFDNNLDGIVDKSFRYGGIGDQIIVGEWL